MHSLCCPRWQWSVSQEAIYSSRSDLPTPLSMLLLQNKLHISVKSSINKVCFTIPPGFGFGIECLKRTLHFTLTSLWQVWKCQESQVFKRILVWDHQKFRNINIIPMVYSFRGKFKKWVEVSSSCSKMTENKSHYKSNGTQFLNTRDVFESCLLLSDLPTSLLVKTAAVFISTKLTSCFGSLSMR